MNKNDRKSLSTIDVGIQFHHGLSVFIHSEIIIVKNPADVRSVGLSQVCLYNDYFFANGLLGSVCRETSRVTNRSAPVLCTSLPFAPRFTKMRTVCLFVPVP